MPLASNAQVSFLGGEWSKSAHGRMGDPRYRTAMAVCRNLIPLPENSVTRRPGFQTAAATRLGLPGKLLPMVRGADESYTLELTEGHLRFYERGKRLLAGSTFSVTDIAQTSGKTRVTQAAHGLVGGETVRVIAENAEAQFKFRKLLNRYFLVVFVDANNFDLADDVTQAVLTDSFSTFGTSEVSIDVITDLETPYTNGKWASTRILMSDDRVVLLEGSTPIQTLTTTSIDPTLLIDGPYLDPFPNSIMTPDALVGVITLTLSFQAYDATRAYSIGDYVTDSSVNYRSLTDLNEGNTPASSATDWVVVTPAEIINNGAGFGVGDAGRHIRLYSEPLPWDVATAYSLGDKVSYADTYWSALQATTGDEPGVSASDWVVDPNAARWTWGKITAASVTDTVDGLLTPSSTIGNLSNASRAYDGLTGVNDPQCTLTNSTSNGYLGYLFAAASQVSAVRVYPNEDGFANNFGNPISGTLQIYASHTAPSNSTDGTLLGSDTFTAGQQTAVTILSNDVSTLWEYVWVTVIADPGNDITKHLVEFQVFDTSGAPAGAQIDVQLVGDDLLYTTAIRTWRLGLYNNSDPKWPTNGCYHQGRFWLAGATKNRFDASKSNAELDFSPTASDGAVADNNAISYTLNAAQKNQIIWMKPDDRGIIAGTAGGEHLIHASNNNNVMTPTNIQADQIAGHGCSDVEPVHTGLTTVFVHESPRHLLEGMRDAYSGQFVAPELTEVAKHLTKGGIAEIAFSHALVPIVWARTNEGKLIGTTYLRQNLVSQEPPAYNGFHRHDFGSERLVTSISSGPGIHDDLDTLVIMTEARNGAHYVEFECHMTEEDETIYETELVDSAIVPSAGEVYTSGTVTGVRFHGLHYLNGESVAVFAAGIDCGDFTVTDGYAEVPYGGLFTATYLNQLSAQQNDYGHLSVSIDQGALVIPAIVGYSFTSQGQVLRPVASDATGAANGPGFGKTRRNHQYGVLVNNTQGLYVGTKFTKLRPALFQTEGGRRYSATELFSGLYVDPLDDDNSTEGMLCWEISRPLPATVLAIGGFLQTQDR